MGKNKKGQPNRAKGKQFGNTDCDSLSKQLRQNGFTVSEMLGDGNCLFRAFSHQLDGHCRNHIQYRIKVVDYIKNNRLEFEPFIEDDVKFEDHVKELLEPGTYGGNDSIVAFSRVYGVTIVIHQFNSPAWVVHAPPGKDAPTKILHISYHNGDHYNSVVKLNGAVALTQEENKNNSGAVGGGGDNSTKSKKSNNNNNNNEFSKNSKSSEAKPPSSSSTELPHIENLKITNEDQEPTKGKNKKNTGQENTSSKPTSQNKPNQKNLSRRQKLDQKKKERKAESMQRKRGGSISEAAQKITINTLGNTPIVKTLNI